MLVSQLTGEFSLRAEMKTFKTSDLLLEKLFRKTSSSYYYGPGHWYQGKCWHMLQQKQIWSLYMKID